MHDDLPATRRPRAFGDLAVAAGVGALGVTLLPVVGELVAVPVGVLALVLGLLGLRRWERGLEHDAVRPAVGAGLGALALVVVLVMVLAAH